jgi:hypothetical protein
MFWFLALGIISFILLLAGSLSAVVIMRRYQRRSEANRTRAMAEMMRIADEAGEKEN